MAGTVLIDATPTRRNSSTSALHNIASYKFGSMAIAGQAVYYGAWGF